MCISITIIDRWEIGERKLPGKIILSSELYTSYCVIATASQGRRSVSQCLQYYPKPTHKKVFGLTVCPRLPESWTFSFKHIIFISKHRNSPRFIFACLIELGVMKNVCMAKNIKSDLSCVRQRRVASSLFWFNVANLNMYICCMKTIPSKVIQFCYCCLLWYHNEDEERW